jgi:hypothetical protein
LPFRVISIANTIALQFVGNIIHRTGTMRAIQSERYIYREQFPG